MPKAAPALAVKNVAALFTLLLVAITMAGQSARQTSLDHSQNCKDPINAAPGHAAVKASLHALLLWVRENKAPEKSPLLELGDTAAPDPIARDKFGNVRGGIRLPEAEVPTASVNGLANSPADPKGYVEFLPTLRHDRAL